MNTPLKKSTHTTMIATSATATIPMMVFFFPDSVGSSGIGEYVSLTGSGEVTGGSDSADSLVPSTTSLTASLLTSEAFSTVSSVAFATSSTASEASFAVSTASSLASLISSLVSIGSPVIGS